MVTIRQNDVVIGDVSYDIISQKNELIRRIAKMPNVTRASMMNESLRTSQNSVISKVRTLFGQGKQTKMQLTNGLMFELEDFTHVNSDPNAQAGSTWLGYMMRNNLLGSSANILGYKELRISNVRVLPKGFAEEKPVEKEVEQAKQQRKIVVKGDSFFDELAKLRNLTKIVDESDIDAARGTEEQESFMKDVVKYFDDVLGENGKVEFSNTD
jgi:hypothetical protein